MNKKYCSVCGCEIKGYGNNAYPITNGRCCDACNDKVVEMRIMLNSLVSKIDELVGGINNEYYGQLFAFTYGKLHYAFAIYKNKEKKLAVKVRCDEEDGWGMFTNSEILRMCIQNYLDNNHKDKKLWNVRQTDDFMVNVQLAWHFEEYLNKMQAA